MTYFCFKGEELSCFAINRKYSHDFLHMSSNFLSCDVMLS